MCGRAAHVSKTDTSSHVFHATWLITAVYCEFLGLCQRAQGCKWDESLANGSARLTAHAQDSPSKQYTYKQNIITFYDIHMKLATWLQLETSFAVSRAASRPANMNRLAAV